MVKSKFKHQINTKTNLRINIDFSEETFDVPYLEFRRAILFCRRNSYLHPSSSRFELTFGSIHTFYENNWNGTVYASSYMLACLMVDE